MKIRIVLLSLLAFIVFCGASPWEGAGATAPDGELPATGRYVATNSFPRNTVVDIINIETNKSTRAIVANTLDSPGLLAVVSREAAELIGMRQGSISRIRMTQPSDPIAYSRFTDAIDAGITDYDSGELYPEDYLEEVYAQDDYIPPDLEQESPAIAVTTPQERASTTVNNGTPTINREMPPEVPSANVSQTPGYVLEPEWGGNRNREIVDLPEYIAASEPAQDFEEPAEIEPVIIAEQEPEENVEEIAEYEPEDQLVEEIAEQESEEEYTEEIAEQEPEEEYTEEIAEYEPQEEYPEEPLEEIAEVFEYDIVPADERPPENNIYGIDPADIIPEIARVEPEPEPFETIAPITPAVSDTDFSVPRIYELSRGWYYVQVAALDSVESVESTIDKIDRSYKPVVYKDGDHWYRVLLGPLNQGESAAILQRFKSIGYKDAFVRRAR